LIISSEASAQANIVVRALGPSLGVVGVTGALLDPTVELHNSNGDLVALNDNWRDTQEGIIASTGLEPNDDPRGGDFPLRSRPGLYCGGSRKRRGRPASDWLKPTISRSATRHARR
jgi:hypothetical protein